MYDLSKLVREIFGITLYGYQLKFLYDCLNHKQVIGSWSRQSGKSVTVAIFSIFEALRTPNGHVVIVAPTDRQSAELFIKISTFLENSPLRNEITNFTLRELTLKNGCRISAYPTGDRGENIRGLTANPALIIEEAAFVPDNIISQVLTPMVAATNGKIIKISTPFGQNHFYRSFNSPEWKSHRYTCWDAITAGHITKEFIERVRNETTSIEFATEYEAEFIPDQDAYFPTALIQNNVSNHVYATDIITAKQYLQDNPKNEYVLGCDPAGPGKDDSALVIVEKRFDNGELRVCLIWHYKQSTQMDTAQRILALNNIFRFKKVFCDYTGLGIGLVDLLRADLAGRLEGISFTIDTKMDMYSNLKLLLEKGALKLVDHKKLIFQLVDLRYELSGSKTKIHHPERGFDDLPTALALSCLYFRPTVRYKPLIATMGRH